MTPKLKNDVRSGHPVDTPAAEPPSVNDDMLAPRSRRKRPRKSPSINHSHGGEDAPVEPPKTPASSPVKRNSASDKDGVGGSPSKKRRLSGGTKNLSTTLEGSAQQRTIPGDMDGDAAESPSKGKRTSHGSKDQNINAPGGSMSKRSASEDLPGDEAGGSPSKKQKSSGSTRTMLRSSKSRGRDKTPEPVDAPDTADGVEKLGSPKTGKSPKTPRAKNSPKTSKERRRAKDGPNLGSGAGDESAAKIRKSPRTAAREAAEARAAE
ncbi:hypothetical protein LTS18_010551, partial [Coniosporium uncinatum]